MKELNTWFLLRILIPFSFTLFLVVSQTALIQLQFRITSICEVLNYIIKLHYDLNISNLAALKNRF